MIAFAVLAVVAGLLLAFVAAAHYLRNSLPKKKQIELRRDWEYVKTLEDPEKRVLEADKVFDAFLYALGYKGSFGEKLKKAGPRFSNLNAIWSTHKLRNKLAHETRFTVTNEEATAALKAYEEVFNRFLY